MKEKEIMERKHENNNLKIKIDFCRNEKISRNQTNMGI